MKLLILTQSVDLDDPVLGFFHRWIIELSKRFETVHVICLKRGKMNLPSNVSVHSLGKESEQGGSLLRRGRYVAGFYRYIWKLRREYDAVFVHMNQEYVLLGAPLWRLWGKRVYMWRNHFAGSFLTNVAAAWCDKVFCTSKHSYTARFKKTILMPIGIDTELFSPAKELPKPGSILFLGRLDAPKRAEIFIRALEILHEQGVPFSATIVGDPSDPSSKYAHDVRNLAAPLVLEGVLAMQSGVTNEKARDLFRSHSIYCNLTPSGSFDKTIGEAMASGCAVVCSNDAVRGVVPEQLMAGESAESAARALRAALEMNEIYAREVAERSRAYVESEHSLALLTERLFSVFSS